MDCIDGQVDNDLFELNAVPRDLRELGDEIKGHDDPFGLQLMAQETINNSLVDTCSGLEARWLTRLRCVQ